MAANVLNSRKAVQASVYVVRAFVRLRQFLHTHRELAAKLAELERKLGKHDDQILVLIDAIRQLMAEPEPPARPRNSRNKYTGPVSKLNRLNSCFPIASIRGLFKKISRLTAH